MDAQEIFDTVATHLFTQGRRAKNDDGKCVYRAADGTKCAVGILIPDADYSEFIEETSADDAVAILAKNSPACAALVPHSELLEELQKVHDAQHHWMDSEIMRDALREVADRLDLDSTIVNDLSFKDR